ncbi:hypothetical protein ANN_22280 [Periplaneta americana]|uniref:Uncharacterized protein n=1 Tax=Periplaneta americana TaxID=6978 RepID=A0ABQ8S8H3_PERAM|nr:hypothetical protein ANN_22280 [Periplaneta americana]
MQALKPEDKVLRRDFCISMQTLIENGDEFIRSVVFSDEVTFHLSGKVNRHNLRIWGSENPRTYVELDYRLDKCPVTKRRHIEQLQAPMADDRPRLSSAELCHQCLSSMADARPPSSSDEP